jgi:hypothetical protein
VYKELPLVVDTFAKTTVQPIENWQETAIKLKPMSKCHEILSKKGYFKNLTIFFSVKKRNREFVTEYFYYISEVKNLKKSTTQQKSLLA